MDVLIGDSAGYYTIGLNLGEYNQHLGTWFGYQINFQGSIELQSQEIKAGNPNKLSPLFPYPTWDKY